MNLIMRIWKTNLHYPISAVYIAGALVAVAVANGLLELGTGLILLSLLSLAVYMVAVRREVMGVRVLVTDHLLARIDVLVLALIAAGVELPAGESNQPATSKEPRR